MNLKKILKVDLSEDYTVRKADKRGLPAGHVFVEGAVLRFSSLNGKREACVSLLIEGRLQASQIGALRN